MYNRHTEQGPKPLSGLEDEVITSQLRVPFMHLM
jgi:hypothetical protein